MTGPEYVAEKILSILAVGTRQALAEDGLHHAATALSGDYHIDRVTRRAHFTLRTELAVEHLPDQAMPFAVRGIQSYPTWLTWFDHFKATYRLRWWARWWVRRHPPRHRWTEVAVNQHITVPLRAAWKFPYIPVTPADLGRSYLHVWTGQPTVDWTDSDFAPEQRGNVNG
jgi:hypothetical protein